MRSDVGVGGYGGLFRGGVEIDSLFLQRKSPKQGTKRPPKGSFLSDKEGSPPQSIVGLEAVEEDGTPLSLFRKGGGNSVH